MKKLLLVIAIVCSLMCVSTPVFAQDSNTTNVVSVDSDKAKSAAFVVGISSACAAIAMGMAISKASEGISRQPEAAGEIRSSMMLGLVFIETAIIYALIVAILIIFVL